MKNEKPKNKNFFKKAEYEEFGEGVFISDLPMNALRLWFKAGTKEVLIECYPLKKKKTVLRKKGK